MWRVIAPMALIALSQTGCQGTTEDPKFAQLTPKILTTATAPDLGGGVIFGGGALDLSSTPSAMILGEIKGPQFIHVKLLYKGEHTDPNTNIPGYLYQLDDKTYHRYFFVSKTGIRGTVDNERHVIDYDETGTL